METCAARARELRSRLHWIPEASMYETETKAALLRFLREETELELIDCGSWFYAKYRAGENAQTVAFRADFDAVTGEDGISRHLCGHDGHAAILAAFGKWVSDHRPPKNVILLFQPGEESGEGAKLCCDLFRRESVDAVYGLHNLPGYPLGQILLRQGTFACASEGLEIRLTGSPAHAAYPEFGANPAEAMSKLVLRVSEQLRSPRRGMALSTVIGMEAGSDRYGVSASEGVLRFTVRAEYAEEFEELTGFVRDTAFSLAREAGLRCEIAERDVFPATENHAVCVENLRQAAGRAGLTTADLSVPMRWSEDFSWYLRRVPGAIFGVGSGESCPALHTADYEFPDGLIPNALALYRELCR